MAIESRIPGTESDGVSRRLVLRTAAVAGAAAAGMGLAACGGDDSSTGTSTGGGSTPADTGAATPAEPSGGGGGAAGAIARTADIPVQGGKIVNAGGKKVVVTQPAEGQFKAFTAVCTHQGCTVNKVADNVIQCPCHGSQFSAEDGSVKRGPAPNGLAAVPVKVSGDSIVQG